MAVQLVRSSWILILLIDWMCVWTRNQWLQRFSAEQLKGWSCNYWEGGGWVLSVQFWKNCLKCELYIGNEILAFPPHSRNGETSHPQNTGEKVRPRKRTERTCGRWSLCFPISICFPCCFIVPKSSHASHKQKPSCTVVERTDLYLKSWSATLAGWPQASHNPSLTYKMGIPPPTLQCLYITVAAPRPAPFISRQKTRPYYLVLVLPLKGEEGKLALLILSQCHSAFHLCLPDKLHFFLFLSFCSDWPSYSKMECIPIGQPQTQAPSFSLTFTTHQSGNF